MAVLLVGVIPHPVSGFLVVISVDLLPVTYAEGQSAPVAHWLDIGGTKLLDTPPPRRTSFLLLKRMFRQG